MKIGFYYALVKNRFSGKREILKVQRETIAEVPVSCYTRMHKDIEEKHEGMYETSALAFGELKIEFYTKDKIGSVWIGHTKVGLLTTSPTLISVGVDYPIGTFFLSPPPNLQIGDPELIELRDLVTDIIGDATWVMK